MVELHETHAEVLRQKNLPRVGQTIRRKEEGTLWRVLEKREVWKTTTDDPETGDPRMIPAIYLVYWKIRPGVMPGVGEMRGHAYTLHDNTFEANWEIVEQK